MRRMASIPAFVAATPYNFSRAVHNPRKSSFIGHLHQNPVQLRIRNNCWLLSIRVNAKLSTSNIQSASTSCTKNTISHCSCTNSTNRRIALVEQKLVRWKTPDPKSVWLLIGTTVGSLWLCPCHAQETVDSSAATSVVKDATDATAALANNTALDRILGTILFGSIVYITIAVILLSINEALIRDNDRKHREWLNKRMNGEEYPDLQFKPKVDKVAMEFGTAAAKVDDGLNRQQRRDEKKKREKQDRAKKKKEETAKARAAEKGKSESNKQ